MEGGRRVHVAAPFPKNAERGGSGGGGDGGEGKGRGRGVGRGGRGGGLGPAGSELLLRFPVSFSFSSFIFYTA